jgi:hypothetical protein
MARSARLDIFGAPPGFSLQLVSNPRQAVIIYYTCTFSGVLTGDFSGLRIGQLILIGFGKMWILMIFPIFIVPPGPR